jgi:hypothetical protein
MLEVSRRGDEQVPRLVAFLEVSPDDPGGHRRDRFDRPLDRASERMVGPEMLVEEIVDELVRSVVHHPDLLEDDLALLFDLRGIEIGVEHDVGEQIERHGEMLVQDLGVETGVFLGGEGVDLSADRVDGQGDFLGAPIGRALEQKMLNEMRDTVLGRRFVPRAFFEPNSHRNRAEVRHPLGHDRETVAKYFLLNQFH